MSDPEELTRFTEIPHCLRKDNRTYVAADALTETAAQEKRVLIIFQALPQMMPPVATAVNSRHRQNIAVDARTCYVYSLPAASLTAADHAEESWPCGLITCTPATSVAFRNAASSGDQWSALSWGKRKLLQKLEYKTQLKPLDGTVIAKQMHEMVVQAVAR